jgi:hypothetical protein
MTGLVIAPPLWPFFAALVVHDLRAGVPSSPASAFALIETVLWMSACLFGTGSILWLALVGMKRRKLLGLWPYLPLLFPYYLLTSVAAWLALYDLSAALSLALDGAWPRQDFPASHADARGACGSGESQFALRELPPWPFGRDGRHRCKPTSRGFVAAEVLTRPQTAVPPAVL